MDIVCRATVYDRCYGVEPEAMVAEPGVMGVSHRGYDVGARGYAMTGVMGWSQRLCCKSQSLREEL